MNTTVEIDAGVCGFRTTARITSEDQQHVAFEVRTDCEKIGRLDGLLREHGPIDAFEEISPTAVGPFMQAVRSVLTGCCVGCAVPVGLFKGMQVAAGLALPKDISIHLSKE